jgi:two-component system LytT family response regulator
VIKTLSSKISFIELIVFFTDAFKAIDFLQKEKVDLIFLDIRMPDISVIDF